MGRPAKYPPEFRREAVELGRSSDRSVVEGWHAVLGSPIRRLHNWLEADREARAPVPIHSFRVGDVLREDDAVSLFAANLAMAFNDLVFTNVRMDDASSDWERFYFSRLAFGHLNEVMLYLESARQDPEAAGFVARLPEEAWDAHADALRRYEEDRAVLNRLRNETVFHYPTGSSVHAISRAIREAADDTGHAGSNISTKVKDARMFFADELVARMVVNASGGTPEAYAGTIARVAEAVASFMRFVNAALDQLLVERRFSSSPRSD